MIHSLKNRDRLATGITTDGNFKYAVLSAKNIVNEAKIRHELNPVTAILTGQLLVGSLLFASALKGEERIILKLLTDGPVKQIVAEANSLGEVRGYALHPNALATKGSTARKIIKNTLGCGSLYVTKILTSRSRPVTGIVELKHSQIARDLTWYFATSEQIPTAIRLNIELVKNDIINSAYGVLVQALPGAGQDSIKQIEENISKISFPANNKSHKLFNAYIQNIFKNVNSKSKENRVQQLKITPADFFCRCSKSSFENSLLTLGKIELNELMSEGTQELVCQYCNEKYYFSPDDLKRIAELI